MKITPSNALQPTVAHASTPGSEKESAAGTAATTQASTTWQPSHDTRVKGEDVDQKKVDAIKQAIQDGNFTIDLDRIADGLIQDTHDYLKDA